MRKQLLASGDINQHEFCVASTSLSRISRHSSTLPNYRWVVCMVSLSGNFVFFNKFRTLQLVKPLLSVLDTLLCSSFFPDCVYFAVSWYRCCRLWCCWFFCFVFLPICICQLHSHISFDLVLMTFNSIILFHDHRTLVLSLIHFCHKQLSIFCVQKIISQTLGS